MTRHKSLWLVVLVLFCAFGAAADERFPQPAELKPDVDFWLAIFSRYSSDEGVLHDNRHLGVVYERVDMPARLSRRERQRRVSAQRKQLQAVLRSLAGGKRSNLTAEEARILALWPEDVSNETLAAAVGRIRYQQGLSDRFRQGLERSGRWRDFIETEFTALGVPIELAALPHVESSYNPNARSHVGASGIWQFTRSTGRRFMRVDHVLDERNDPFTATQSAGKLLAYNYSITGNWPMAITAYNHGLAGVRRAMRQHGDTAYVDILRNYRGRTFGFASRNFYVAFLAAKEIDTNPERYFPGVRREAPTQYVVAELDAYLPATDLSAALGVSESALRRYNPAAQETIWTGNKHWPKGAGVRVPASMVNGSIDDLLAGVPSDRWASKQLPDLYHTIVRGDTLSQIAQRYDTSVSTLVALNNLGSRHRIRAGQRLRLPAAGPAPAPPVQVAAATPTPPPQPEPEPEPVADEPAPAEEPVAVASLPAIDAEEPSVEEVTPAALASEVTTVEEAPLQTALLSDPSDYSVADDLTIEVQPLETLGHFADWLGIRTQRLRDVNGFAFRTPVAVGQRIKLVIDDIDVPTFESRRIAYHRNQQDQYFREHVITGVTEHVVERGESIWILSLRQYGVPIWLFRQYNPELDPEKIRPGTTIRFPVLVDVERS
ncbi:MAG: LysM peptidoglycan-binding domain-containing protein [Woeseiaceae bacterium]|nr:LysM peptidoglycan-binding domain-containing protein [Woeseiaceae bacterium]